MRVLRWIGRAVGVILDIVGLAGIPDDAQQWAVWISHLDERHFRLLLVVVGTAIIALTLPWRRWLVKPASSRSARTDRGGAAVAGDGQAVSGPVGGDIIGGDKVIIQTSSQTDNPTKWARFILEESRALLDERQVAPRDIAAVRSLELARIEALAQRYRDSVLDSENDPNGVHWRVSRTLDRAIEQARASNADLFNQYYDEAIHRLREWVGSVPSDGPRIVLNGDDACHVATVGFLNRSERFVADVVSLRLINSPVSTSEASVARDVRAKIRVTSGGATCLPTLDARWSDTVQPRVQVVGGLARMLEPPQLAVDFGIDEPHELNLAIKRVESELCYLFNNDSYLFGFEHPGWEMKAETYSAEVTVSGVGFPRHVFECVFRNPGRGRGLEVRSAKQLAPDTAESQRQ